MFRKLCCFYNNEQPSLDDLYDKYKYINSKFKDHNNQIELVEKIGQGSCGIVYKSKLMDDNKNNYFATKIELNFDVIETEMFIAKKLKDYNSTEFKNPHLPLIFNNNIMLCSNLANGNFENYYKKIANNDVKLWKNAIEQIYMSLASLHSLGLIHNDTHDNNFLFYKIKPGGCFHYEINGTDYYIENIGYLWNVWDFGICITNYRYTEFIKDYNFFNLFLRKNDENKKTRKFIDKFKYFIENHLSKKVEWGKIDDNVKIPIKIQEIEKILWNLTGSDINNYEIELIRSKIDESIWLKDLLDNNILFSKNPIGNIIADIEITIPLYTNKVINNTSNFYIELP